MSANPTFATDVTTLEGTGVCGVVRCDRDDHLRVIHTNGRDVIRCRYHAKHFLGVSS
jgi:hypothetical protein